MSSDDLTFAPEPELPGGHVAPGSRRPWKVLLVDDEPDIHTVTRLALSDFEFENRPLSFLHAYSAREGERLLESHDDIAVALVDVVMENEHAGLDLVRHVRDHLDNHLVRIVLRTGQPGHAPERSIVRTYEIDDYREKTDLTTEKLHTTILTNLRSYRQIEALHRGQAGLREVIDASGEIFRIRRLDTLLAAVLDGAVTILARGGDTLAVARDSLVVELRDDRLVVLAGTGEFATLEGVDARVSLDPHVLSVVEEGLATASTVVREGSYVGWFGPVPGRRNVVCVARADTVGADDARLCSLFLRHTAIAYESGLLREELLASHEAIGFRVAEAIERRRGGHSEHARRFAALCTAIARGLGMPEHEVDLLRIAAPLHDLGKVAIPEALLTKSGPLDASEWQTMRTHAALGAAMFGNPELDVLRIAALLARDHHENWDGSGYPLGLSGTDISLVGRIGAVADTLDALTHPPRTGSPRSPQQIVECLVALRETRFDPCIVDWVVENVDAILAIGRTWPDA